MTEGRVLQVLGPSTGGIRRHVVALREALQARGWVVGVAGPEGLGDGGVEIDVDVPVPSRADPVAVAKAVRRLARALEGYDVVHAHGLKAGWVASLARARPLVLTVHNRVVQGQGGRLQPVLRSLERRLPGRADAVIATSTQLGAELALRLAADRLHVIPPTGPAPVVARSRSAVRDELGVAFGAPLVVGVGRLHPQKGWPVLLDAVAGLRGRHPSLRLVIAGAGPLEGSLRAQVVAQGLQPVVMLVGARTDAADLLAAADVVAMASVWESGPLVLAEAMALGRPVVATDVGFAPDLVDDGVTGRLVPAGDVVAMVRALDDLLRDPARAATMALAGRHRVAVVLDRERLVGEVEAVYREVRRGP